MAHIEEIEIREKTASPGPLTKDEIEERRRNLFFFFSEGDGNIESLFDVRLGEMLAWLATFDYLLAQLRDRDEKLAALEEFARTGCADIERDGILRILHKGGE